jgi:tetratricopeptide (TPR) repeat protein
MATGRILLEQNRPQEAVEVLQKHLLHADGNAKYLGLLRDAMNARIMELQRLQANPQEIESLRRQLAILDRGNGPTPPKEAPSAIEPVVALDPTPGTKTANNNASKGDPFQQVPLDRQAKVEAPVLEPTPETPSVSKSRERAMQAYDQKKYREANQLFKQAAASDLTDEEKLAWGYAKLHEVSTILNQTGDAAVPVAKLQTETRQALELGGEKLNQWGQQVLAELGKRQATPSAPEAIPQGWEVIETANFRIVHCKQAELAQEIARGSELARSAMYERWSGPVASTWVPKCDVWLHIDGASYSQATGQRQTSPGHSTIDLKGKKVLSRRIDLRADAGDTLDTILPHEVTYLIVQELFADQPLPRWAEVAMTVMSEPPSQVSRYLRAVPKLAKEKRLLPVAKLLSSTEFPDEANATPFFVESVSLVDYLVRLKGAKAFAVFLREAPRRGYDKALQTHYGIKDTTELQERWLKFAGGQ